MLACFITSLCSFCLEIVSCRSPVAGYYMSVFLGILKIGTLFNNLLCHC